MRSTKAKINLAAIRHNFEVVKQLAPKAKVMAVLKADAYGHGILQVAKTLDKADAIAVACLDEAETLRAGRVENEIILLEGVFGQSELERVIQLDLQMVIHQSEQLTMLEQLPTEGPVDKRIKVWLKLDSGMNRLGFSTEAFMTAYQTLKQCPWVESIHLMSHLACADDIQNPMTLQQIERFNRTTESMVGERSLANSAGIVAWPESHYQWVRPGIILYGCSPMLELTGPAHGLLPAMTLESKLFAIKPVASGESVGYGAQWQTKENTRIGVIAIGYGDGYPRHAAVGTPVRIRGKNYPLVGRVSMDMITVDLGLEDSLEVGDKAILWGEELPVEIVAKHADTVAYTLLCGVTSRVKFEWTDD